MSDENENTIDAEGASDYFSTRTTRRSQWAKYEKKQQEAAVVEATDLFASTFHEPPNPDNSRECECIYEEALYLLSRFSTPKGSGAEEPALNGPEIDGELLSASESNYGMWTTLALRKLGEVRVITRNVVG